MKIGIVDTETTGLESGKHRVLEAAGLLVELTSTGIVQLQPAMVIRQRVELKEGTFQPKALEVNGYYDGHPDWVNAPMADTIDAMNQWDRFNEYLDGTFLCSQNVPFDRGFLEAELKSQPFWGRRCIELMSFSAFFSLKLNQPKWGLHEIYKALGGPELQEHRAEADVKRGLYVLQKAHEAFFTA